MNLHQMMNFAIFIRKKYIFLIEAAEKLITTIISLTKEVRENISPAREQDKSLVRKFSLSPVREDQSPVRVATKTGKKHQGEGNDQEKSK